MNSRSETVATVSLSAFLDKPDSIDAENLSPDDRELMNIEFAAIINSLPTSVAILNLSSNKLDKLIDLGLRLPSIFPAIPSGITSARFNL